MNFGRDCLSKIGQKKDGCPRFVGGFRRLQEVWLKPLFFVLFGGAGIGFLSRFAPRFALFRAVALAVGQRGDDLFDDDCPVEQVVGTLSLNLLQ